MKPTLSIAFAAASTLLTTLVFSVSLNAQTGQQSNRQLTQGPAQSQTNSQKRLALVIGNGAYQYAGRLANPPNDAMLVAATLRQLGFDVKNGSNLTQREMKQRIREFGQTLRANGGVGLFYFAGHGVQAKGHNYLVPVDADIQTEADLEDVAVDLNYVLSLMDDAQNALNIVVLDACRNNPFARSFRSAQGGLAQVRAPTGTLIAYATAPDSVAADGAGTNSPYSQEFVKQMETPGVLVETMFRRVTEQVSARTNGKQEPWFSANVKGDFYFRTAGSNSTSKSNLTSPAAAEMREEAHHHLKFENEFVRVWDVTVPAGDATLWHIHRFDNVIVGFGNAHLRVETVGAATSDSKWKFGEVRFAKATYTHRATNVGTTDFHNCIVEFLKSLGPASGPKPNEAIDRPPVLDNERARVYRITLEPGQSTTVHTQAGLSIAITAGDIEVTIQGNRTPDRLSRIAGDIHWRANPVTYSMKNIGKMTFEVLDIQLK